ncbi:hypothetical protein [Sulfuricystis multivorans]|uniref:hypothetical protein n=1 Tax=Sulfuricystis multivorans TaxID=2211108 RepID=UPI000F819FCF|nr:hypothetical protein [Sulfuricystis multivorans]
MDEQSYRITRQQINPLPCVFEKALLSRVAACEAASRALLAEREMFACRDPLVRAACGQLLLLLRQNAAFALKVKDTQRILPHAMMMKVQCGGLIGLKDLLDPEALAPDVKKLVMRAQAEYGALENLPFSRIVQGISHWQIRKRGPPRS